MGEFLPGNPPPSGWIRHGFLIDVAQWSWLLGRTMEWWDLHLSTELSSEYRLLFEDDGEIGASCDVILGGWKRSAQSNFPSISLRFDCHWLDLIAVATRFRPIPVDSSWFRHSFQSNSGRLKSIDWPINESRIVAGTRQHAPGERKREKEAGKGGRPKATAPAAR